MKYITFISFLSYFVYGTHFKIAQDPNNIFDIGNEKDKKDKKDFEDEDFEFSNIEVEEDKVEVETDSKNYELKYEIKCEETDPIETKLKYESTNLSGFETETKSRVLIHGIQEWFDENQDGIMQDNEKIGEMYFVGENQYDPITYVGPDSYNVYDFTISEKAYGFLTMIAHLTSNFTTFYDPNSMKFDIIIQDWVYQNSNNQLALLMEYKTENEMETQEKDEGGYVSQKTSTPSLGYSALIWNSTIVYDDTSVGLVSARMLNTTELNSLIQTDDEYEGEETSGIWFCFSPKGAASIYWDPSIGVYTTPVSSSSSASSSSSDNYLSSTTVGGIVAACVAGCVILSVFYYIRVKVKSYKDTKKTVETDTAKLYDV
jgi:hypothetical protein